MHRRWLDDGAARGDQPVKPLSLRKPGDWASRRISGADTWNRLQMLAYQLDIDSRPQSFEPLLVQVDACGEVALFQAEDNNAGVDELLPLDARHHTNRGVIK